MEIDTKKEVRLAVVGLRDILAPVVSEDVLPEILKRLDRLIDAKINASNTSMIIAMAGRIEKLEAKRQVVGHDPEPIEIRIHASDCAVNNGPALPVGPCNC